jgi:hypothetical protein
MTPHRFAQRVRADLRARRWLRWHCSLIGLFTLLAGWACSHALMRLGTDALWVRYGASFAVAYGVLMLLLYLWARWLLSRDEADWLQIDGGVSVETVERCAAAGVDSFVAGSSVFGAADPDAVVGKLRELAAAAA